MRLFPTHYRGFTLPEILVTVGILSILAVIAIIAIDPVHRFEDARNSRRLSDIQTVTGALHQYTIDHRGILPEGLDQHERQIGTGKTGCALQTSECTIPGDTDCIDLTTVLDPYLHGVPIDPSNGNEVLTHYSVHLGTNNAIVVRACDLSEKIQ